MQCANAVVVNITWWTMTNAVGTTTGAACADDISCAGRSGRCCSWAAYVRSLVLHARLLLSLTRMLTNPCQLIEHLSTWTLTIAGNRVAHLTACALNSARPACWRLTKYTLFFYKETTLPSSHCHLAYSRSIRMQTALSATKLSAVLRERSQ